MAKDVLPDALESREFKASTAKLVAEAKRAGTPQRTKFEELARESGADEDPQHFEDIVRRIAKVPAKDQSAKPE